MLTGSVRLLDKSHLRLPKIGRLRFRGLPPKLLAKAAVIRIGTVTISMDATGRYYVSLQLTSEQPFVELTQVEKSPIGIDLNTDNFLTDSNGYVVSTTLIKNHDLVVAEELRSKNLLRDHALALSIANVGWRAFLGMLAYKAKLYGRQFITINPRNTTQTCSHCGFVMGTNKTQRS